MNEAFLVGMLMGFSLTAAGIWFGYYMGRKGRK